MPDLKDTTAATSRPLPSNLEAERSVLAASMLNPEIFDEIASILDPESFSRPAHQTIFSSMMDMASRSIPIDQISLADNLRALGQLEAVGGKPYLVELANNALSLTNWRTHTEIVKRTSLQRDLIYASASITSLAYDAPDDTNETIDQAEKILFGATQKRVSSTFLGITDLLTQAFNDIMELAKTRDQLAGIPTGFKDVDNLFWGLRGGDLIILAARPAVGKTAFALNVATGAAASGANVLVFSLEMGANQLVQRVLCADARVNLSGLRAGKIQDSDWDSLAQSAQRLSSFNLWIDDTAGLTLTEMRAKARRQLKGKENGLIILDYLQLMNPATARRDGNRAVEVAEISRGLKVLAKELNVPIIALSQLSRAVESRATKRPMLSDLRESGSIEQDADIVMFLDRSYDEVEAASADRPDWGTANLIVAKHRNGSLRDIKLSFSPEYTRFGDYIDINDF
ncbi:MAG: replicative DNA helicase [Eggerthellales bacterium]|nr:replicative DNA helicase [Eggerthellales bacterium]